MLERTVFHGKRPKCWKTTAVRGLGPATGDPASETEPEVTGSRPAIVRSKVVLPPPDVPITQTNSRLATARLTPCRMRAPPSSTQTLSSTRWGDGVRLFPGSGADPAPTTTSLSLL